MTVVDEIPFAEAPGPYEYLPLVVYHNIVVRPSRCVYELDVFLVQALLQCFQQCLESRNYAGLDISFDTTFKSTLTS